MNLGEKKRFIKIWLIASTIFMMFLTVSIFFWDFYSGMETQGFGVLDPYKGMGMFYVYNISYFASLIVVFAILRTDQFGMGFLIWLPYAIIGFFVEYYFEIDALISVWGVIGYCAFGLLSGLSADITYKLLNENSSIKKPIIAGLSGIIMSLVYFLTVIIAIGFFYKAGWGAGSFTEPGSFLGVSYFMVPWMLINAFFGGFTAYALNCFLKKG